MKISHGFVWVKSQLAQHSTIILGVALALGAVLRWLQIGTHDFWYDEAVSALIARLSAIQILANAAADDHPFGYYLLLHYWLWFGDSETVIRSLSALFSLATIPLIYGLGWWLFDKPMATLAALTAAISPFQIYYAQETRFYGVVIFLSTAITWLFLYAVMQSGSWQVWLGYGLAALLGLHFHYFVAFLVIGLHLWWTLNWQKYRGVTWRLLLADGLIAALFLPQLGQALTRTEIYLTGAAWQASPSILSPLTTIYYLLFGHRTPIRVFPISLFLTLTLLILTLWESRRRPKEEQRVEWSLWLCLLTPIFIVMLISWFIRPIYLERSFAVSSPALVLLLARGVISAPRLSPTPILLALLMILVGVTLVMNLITTDPAKPPVQEATQIIANNFTTGDVSLHLQDSSYMPAIWYTPAVPHLLANIPNALFTTIQTHQVLGGQVVEWQLTLDGADRLWLTVMPGFVGPEQKAVLDTIEATYPCLKRWDWGSVQLYLYNLRDAKQ